MSACTMEGSATDEVESAPDNCNKSIPHEVSVRTEVAQKLSYRRWRIEFKKQKRKSKRRDLALLRDATLLAISGDEASSKEEASDEEKEKRRLEHDLWMERERDAQAKFLAKKDREEKERLFREEEQRRIKEAWAEEQRKRKEDEDNVQKRNENKKPKESINLLPLKRNDTWQNPPAPPGYNAEHQEVRNCPFFQKVGACRFGINCKRSHNVPETSSTLLFPGMFANFELEQAFRDEFDSDLTLEYEEGDIYEEFKQFYEDVLPEFEVIGHVTRFVVCCNYEPHLRGNVYVQYDRLELIWRKEEAMSAFEKFNGRWYCKRQLSCQFTAVDNWKSAICGLFHHKKCPKGKNCNFLHVFQNPAPLRCGAGSSRRGQERRENLPQNSRKRSHCRSRSSKMDSDSPCQLSSRSHGKFKLDSPTASDRSSLSSEHSSTSHHRRRLHRSQSRHRHSSRQRHRSKSHYSTRYSRRSMSKSSSHNRSDSSSISPTVSEHQSQSSLKSLSRSSFPSHERRLSPSKSSSRSREERYSSSKSSSHSRKKRKVSKSRKHRHHSKVQNATEKLQTSKSIHSDSDVELEADKRHKESKPGNKSRRSVSRGSDVQSSHASPKARNNSEKVETSVMSDVKNCKHLQSNQQEELAEKKYEHNNENTEKM